ncbi:ArsR/SmtB family transcription factor [Massilia endophytica]|uniref:ArsR/SmtB family transcription factor n=1 Tax=Massilia endophytica TaxID=2899220 RepID=UPI001E35C5E8|nr:metalloregulator ArsR/SmtB family transcription factor [Massilia endophytica]UGQ48332.1 metalloregulator ArsR/SmtB family transcription factor [Massilia endophytica]
MSTLDLKFHALSDATRRALVERLSLGPCSMKELAEPMAVSLPTVLKHLAVLESGAIVISEKQGRVRTFRIAPDAFADMERWVAERKRMWNSRFDKLEQYLEDQ